MAAHRSTPQRMPSSTHTMPSPSISQRYRRSSSSSDDNDHDMAGFETDYEGDNHTSSSYNGARYPTSESHLNPTRSNQTSEYAYNMHANQSIAPRRQATQSSVNVEPLQQDQQHHAYYHAQQRQQYTQQRTPDAVEHDSDKIPYYSSPLMDHQGATHFPGFEDKSSQQYSSHPHSQQMRIRTESNNALPIQPADADDHAYGYTDKGGMLTRKKNDKSKGNNAATVAPAGGEGVSSIVRGYGTPHQIAYLSVVLLQTLATAAMIAIVWAKIRAGTPLGYNGFSSFFSGNDDEASLRRRTITVYLAIFLFGSVFEIITAIDALRLNNTIQLIGVCLFVIAMMVYSALLDGQIENAISIEDGYSADLYPAVRPYIIAMPIIQGVAALILAWFTYKLFRDFGWEVLHLIGADRKLKRIYTKYQIFVCLVKFDFFFFVGFSLQYMILVLKVQEAEFIITIIAFPFTILALVLAVIAVRREIKSLSYVIFVAELCALAYFIFKFFRLFQESQAFRYQNSRKTLAVFSALAIVMLLLTFWCSILCFINYGQGLKEVIPGYFGEHRASRRQQRLARKNSYGAGAMLDERPARMSID